MKMFTSAAFTYPEFDKTIFARVPAADLCESKGGGVGWPKDRENVSKMLEFIAAGDGSRPFMTFMFFESPHAPYHFPPECAIRRPYTEDLNYLTMRLDRDIGLIRNRYLNSCRHLDTQIARVLKGLEEKGLLESTLVLITGDHGEEMMEKGRWGHNSDFTEEQTRVPLVLWIPGHAPDEVTRMTSHLDIPATVLTLLGVTTPPGDYSLGFDLLGDGRREYSVLSDWDHLVYVDAEHKAELPIKTYDFRQQRVTTKDDVEIPDRAGFYEKKRDRLLQVARELKKFRK